MKNNTRKILLALIVALTLLISMATVTVFAEDSAPVDDGTTTIYFENNWLWTDVRCYFWGDGVTCSEFPGEAMNNVGTRNSHELYSIDLPAGVTGLVISGVKDDGSGNRDQTPDITEGIVDNAGWMMRWDNGNLVDSFTYDPANPDEGGSTGGSTGGAATEGTTYTVAGVAALCGSEWSTTDTYNDMTFNAETGLYEKTFTGVPAGFYECKVAADHAWNQSWGGGSGEYGNYGFELTEEMNVTITFNASTKTVGHVTSASTGATERPTPEAPDIDWEDTITVYVGDSAYWNNVYVYCWTQGSSDQNAAWPGVEMEWDGERMLYYYEIPTYYVNIIFSDGNGTQTADMIVPGDGALYDNVTNTWIDIEDYIPPVPAENTTEEVTVHVKDDAGWGEVYVYYWGADGEEPGFAFPGIPMERDENGYFTAVIPAGYWGVVFSNGGDWQDGSLLQTPDLVIPTNGKTYIKNTAKDSTEWYSVGGNQPSGDSTTPDAPADDEPVKEMTFLQKLALKLLLFLRSIEDMFKGIFKK